MDKRLKYRMYFLVPYNLSDIQKGIQAGHAALEYSVKYKDDKEFTDFVFWDKTWIILNGGTCNDGHLGNKKGTMNEMFYDIKSKGIKHSTFYEEDINSALTAICFLADERVWDFETYPDLDFNKIDKINIVEEYKHWEYKLGGDKNVFLRDLIRNKKLA